MRTASQSRNTSAVRVRDPKVREHVKAMIVSAFQFIPGVKVTNVEKDMLNEGTFIATVIIPKLKDRKRLATKLLRMEKHG